VKKSPVAGYRLFQYQGKRGDRRLVLYPNYYVRHVGKEVSTDTDNLQPAITKVKKLALEGQPEDQAALGARG